MNQYSQTGEGRRTAEIESDIQRTRDRMGDDIEAIGDKFRPERIRQRAKEAVSRKGRSLLRAARENPVPTAIVALGLTLLLKARSKTQESENGYAAQNWPPDYEREGLREKMQDAASEAGHTVQHVAEQAGKKAKRTGLTLQGFFERTPIIAGAGIAVLGAAIGALIPETEKENRLMGHARDELIGQAKGAARQAQDTIEQKLSEHGATQTQGERYGASKRQ